MIEENRKKATRSIIEINPVDPATITLSDGSAFKTSKYIIGERLITAMGKWMGDDVDTSKRTVFIPWSSVLTFEVVSTEVNEEDLTTEERQTLENRHKGTRDVYGPGLG